MAVRYWTFFDYVTAGGKNVFADWLDDQPFEAQEDIEQTIRYLEVTERFGRKVVKKLSGKNAKGILEIRVKSNNVQYRPLICFGPDRHQITLLLGAIEKGDKFVPKDAVNRAARNKSDLDRNHDRCTRHGH